MVVWRKIKVTDSLLQTILEYLNEESRHYPKRSTKGGWSSKNHILNIPSLVDFLTEIKHTVEDIAGRELIVRNYFFNVNPIGAYHTPHTHKLVDFSCVVYLKIPVNSGELMWEGGSRMPETGDIAVFPGNLLHWTGVNNSTDTRVCLVMNFF